MELSPMRNEAKGKAKAKPKRVWKLKLGLTWKAIRKVLNSSNLHFSCASSMKQLSTLRVPQGQSIDPVGRVNNKKCPPQPKKPLALLLQRPYSASDFVDNGDLMTPTKSPRETVASKWRELHGLHNWEGLLDPLHPWVRREVVKYGEFVEATYDAFDFDPLSEYCGSCRYNRHKLFEELGLTGHGYKVTKYIYAMSRVDVPKWYEKTHIAWSKDSNWMGYVAVSGDAESERIGRRDILVAWRGTMMPTEWFTDLKTKLQRIGDGFVKVQHGFLSIYRSKDESTSYNRLSASEQVMQELDRLVGFFQDRGEEVSMTICGHSLGGALALLNAYEAANSFQNVFINVINFGAPRAGNMAFKERLTQLGVKTLRVVVKQDIVPKLPGIIFNKVLNKLSSITRRLNWVYRHVGTQLKLDVLKSPYLKRDSDLSAFHNLEIYLHLLDGFFSKKSKFRWNARRDLALVNKTTAMLIEDLKIPEFWYQLPHKGLVLNKIGRWVKPGRQPEDIPSPLAITDSNHDLSHVDL